MICPGDRSSPAPSGSASAASRSSASACLWNRACAWTELLLLDGCLPGVAASVDLGEHRLDGDRSVCGARGPEGVERMLGARQFGVDDGLVAHFPQACDKTAGLRHGNE